INMEEYKDGVYFVRLRKGNDIITRKIIKNS
ncbi:MAG TPA: T9SS type A sorting domain-containing protein, partial [Bacteroidales bacterium]|nr:T9SS type A sorting domain-containing protein [Bacteroidales bacterium]HHU47500.1 T9SS type A sorting domain-containing protein [Bacteroidales bacterium]